MRDYIGNKSTDDTRKDAKKMGKKLIVVSGFSGSGKGTILQKLVAAHPELELIKSYTTRNKRSSNDFYSFVDKDEFLALKGRGRFLESNFYSGEWYGTPLKEVEQCINEGRLPIVEIDPNGYKQILASSFINNCDILALYVVAEPEAIITRLMQRHTEEMDKIIKRSNVSMEECESIHLYDAVIQNDDIDAAVTIVEKAIFDGVLPDFKFNIESYKNDMKHLVKQLKR